MTHYTISIGYNPLSGTPELRWAILKAEARRIADDPQAIIAEARRLGTPEVCEDGCCHLNSFADNYTKPFDSDGHPIHVVDESDVQSIRQAASTDKGFKYHVRRAYCRLLIEAMHRHRIEVNLKVS